MFGYFHSIPRDIFVGVIVLAGTSTAALMWQEAGAWLFPGPLSGKFTTIIPTEGEDQKYQSDVANFSNYKGRFWGTKTSKHYNKSWEQVGFLKNGYMVLSYRSREETGIGFGTYFLRYREVDGTPQYLGEWRGVSCDKKKVHPEITKCPALMIPGEFSDAGSLKLTEEQAAFLGTPCIRDEIGEIPTQPSEQNINLGNCNINPSK